MIGINQQQLSLRMMRAEKAAFASAPAAMTPNRFNASFATANSAFDNPQLSYFTRSGSASDAKSIDVASYESDSAGKPVQGKRALDITIAILALIALAPIMAVIAVVIKIVSPGPILFRQRRAGFMGQPFDCLKFRTMHVNAPTALHSTHLKDLMTTDKPLTKLDQKGDPRVIPFGGILRATGLDELPQLINVLIGEMSLVGPRPCTMSEFSLYSAWHKRRLEAKPGITGLWQVSGKNETTFAKMIELDVEYCETWNLGMDLSILGRTWKVIPQQLKGYLRSLKHRAS